MQDMVGMGVGGVPISPLSRAASGQLLPGHSGMRRQAQTRNLEIPGSMLRIAPE
jgi:hypothetical protein